MRKLWLALFFLISLSSFGQGSRVSLGLDVSLVYPNIRPFGTSSIEYEVSPGFASRITGAYALNEHLELVMGINYTQLGYNVEYNFVFTQPNDPGIPTKSLVSVSYAQVQLLLRTYLIQKDNMDLFLKIGIGPETLIAFKNETLYEDGVTMTAGYLNNNNISLLWGIGFRFNIHEQFDILFELPVEHYLNGFDSFMAQRTSQVGMMVGIIFKLKGDCDTCPSFN